MNLFHQKNLNQCLKKKIKYETLNPYIDFLNSVNIDKSLNKFQDNNIDKLNMLYEASKLNINIPDVLVTNKLSELKKFINEHQKVITKPIQNPIIKFNSKNYSIILNVMSNLVELKDNDPEYFLSSYFQKYIEKKFEIRSFYIYGKFYSMAIFSQQNEKTKIDFRNYDNNRPNRLVAFNLPFFLEKKITKLMKRLKLNCGSIDLIYTIDKEYFFLEVNPIGQFQWLSYNCNYFIEKKIAKKIIKKNNQKKKKKMNYNVEILKKNIEKEIKDSLTELPYLAKYYSISIVDNIKIDPSNFFSNRFYKHISKIITFNE